MTEPVHSLTDAPERHSAEQSRRMVRYAVSMGIRIACFVLAVILQNWLSWVLLAAAVVLPYIAVIDANVGGDRYARTRDAETRTDGPTLLTTRDAAAADREAQRSERLWWEDEELQDAPDLRRPPAEEDPGRESGVIPGTLEGDEDLDDDAAVLRAERLRRPEGG